MHLAPPRRSFAIASLVFLPIAAAAVYAQAPSAAASRGPSRQMQAADLKAWKKIRNPVPSNARQWVAYVLAPNEGDASVIIRSTGADGKELKFPIGEAAAGGG